MHPDLKIYDRQALETINADFEIKVLAEDCQFTEGPVWNPEGFYLFSDIPANVIYRIAEGSKKQVYLSNSGTDQPSDPDLKPDQIGSNALAYDHQGNLLVCQHGSHGIAIYQGGSLQPLITEYEGRPLNSPNDLILQSNGQLFFSDPPYGLREGKLNPGKFQPRAGVYLWRDGKISLICDRYQYPNGVCLSPDERRLYICSNKPFEEFVSVYDTASMKYVGELAKENGDGIDIDRRGNIFLCNRDGLLMLSPQGQRLALLKLRDIPANIAWGGANGNDLLITARRFVLLIKDFQR